MENIKDETLLDDSSSALGSDNLLKRGLRRAKSYSKAVKQFKIAKVKGYIFKETPHFFTKAHAKPHEKPHHHSGNPRKLNKHTASSKHLQELKELQPKAYPELSNPILELPESQTPKH